MVPDGTGMVIKPLLIMMNKIIVIRVNLAARILCKLVLALLL